MWKIFGLLSKAPGIGPTVAKLGPKVASVTTRLGRKRAFRSFTQLATSSGKKKIANRAISFAVQTGVTSALVAAIDNKDGKSDEEILTNLKESLKDEVPGIASCQTLDEVLDLVKGISIQNSLEDVDQDAISGLFQEGASILRSAARVSSNMQPTRTVVSEHIRRQECLEEYKKSFQSVIYLIGYFLGISEAESMLNNNEEVSTIDYLLLGFSKAKCGVPWDTAVFSTPVTKEALDHVTQMVERKEVTALYKSLTADNQMSVTGRDLIISLVESIY